MRFMEGVKPFTDNIISSKSTGRTVVLILPFSHDGVVRAEFTGSST